MEEIPIPVDLLEQLERGNVLILIGEGLSRDTLPSSAKLSKELAERFDYPSGEQSSLPRVAYSYLRKHDRAELVKFLRERLWDHRLPPSRAHRLLCQLPISIIVTTTHDDLLERAHHEASVPYVTVVKDQDVPYTERQKRLLIWLLGRLDQPESLVLTEAERETFFDDNHSLSDILCAELAQHTWLILGFDVQEAWFRRFYTRVVRQLDHHHRPAYLYGDVASDYVREWAKEHNIEILSPDVTAFLERLVQVLSGRKKVLVTQPEEPPPMCPYKGLNPFTADDRRIFFGRDRETQRLFDLVRAHRLVSLYGSSGTGKTSLIQAGLVPLLKGEFPTYTTVVVRTMGDLVQAIRASVGEKVALNDTLPISDRLVDYLAAAAEASHARLVLVLDQFEQFFVQCSSLERRREFYAELSAIVENRTVPVKIVLVLREEWLAALGELEPIIPSIYDVRLRLVSLDQEAARAAIEKPVEPFGIRFDSLLTDRLLNDLGTEAVLPPQVQLVCEALYRSLSPDQREMTLEHYRELGEARGILGRFLTDELDRVPENHRTLARATLEELVSSHGTKAVKTLAELEHSLEVSRGKLQPILNTLDGRLLRAIPRGEEEPIYELAHEYLIEEIHLSPEAVVRKQAEELIAQGVDNWKRLRTMLGKDAFALIDQQREVVHLRPEDQELLLRSAIQHKHNVSYWARRMDADRREALIEQLLSDFDRAEPSLKRQATEALWALKRYLSGSAWVRVTWALIRQQAPVMIKKYALPIGIVLLVGVLLTVGAVYVTSLPIPEEMVEVPAGSFIMGSTPEEVADKIAVMEKTEQDENARKWWRAVYESEKPRRQVYVDTFYIDKYEVTNAQYQRCVLEGVCQAPDSWQETGTFPTQQADYPVEDTSGEDADTYCRWVGRRLPTDEEWEKAARGVDGRLYPWGNEWKDDLANINKGEQGASTHAATYKDDRSAYDAYNMAGNVWEWTASSWSEQSSYVVARGGCWFHQPHRARCAARAPYRPEVRLNGGGFRCASDEAWDPRDWREFIASVLR